MAQGNGFYAYTHSRPDGSVFYVGKGKGRRAWNFTHGRNPYHRSVIRKHGAENIIVTIHPCNSEEAAFELEKWLIFEHPELTNMTDGGEGASGRPISENVRAAFDKHRCDPKTEKARAAAAAALKKAWVENPAMRDNAARMAEARRGVPRPRHVIEAMRQGCIGKKQTGARLEQTRAAQKIAQEAAKPWHSSEEGRKLHEANGRKVWIDREWVECKCEECGRAFASPFPTRAKYCDSRCRNRANKRKAGKPVGVRSQRVAPSVLSGKRAVGQ